MVEAERAYQIAQALPGWTREETDDATGEELDWVIQVAGAYRAVFGGARRRD